MIVIIDRQNTNKQYHVVFLVHVMMYSKVVYSSLAGDREDRGM